MQWDGGEEGIPNFALILPELSSWSGRVVSGLIALRASQTDAQGHLIVRFRRPADRAQYSTWLTRADTSCVPDKENMDEAEDVVQKAFYEGIHFICISFAGSLARRPGSGSSL